MGCKADVTYIWSVTFLPTIVISRMKQNIDTDATNLLFDRMQLVTVPRKFAKLTFEPDKVKLSRLQVTRHIQRAFLDGIQKKSILQVQFNINELFRDEDLQQLAEVHLYAAKV